MATSPDAVPGPLYTPTPEEVERAHITRYRRWLERRYGLAFAGYQSLWEWSVADLEGFWGSIWEHFGIRAHSPYERVLAERTMPGARWFPGATLNYAEHALRGDPDRVAVIACSEDGPAETISFGELARRVGETAAGLGELGVRPGDRVVAYAPNRPETLVAFLAAASVGAVWSACPPEFGTAAVVDRLARLGPKVLFAVSGYRFKGRWFDRTDVVAGIEAALPSLEAVVELPAGRPAGRAPAARHRRPARMAWSELARPGAEPSFVAVPFDHPLWCSTRRAPPACPRPSSTATAGSSSSTSSRWCCTRTWGRATGSSGTPRPAG